MNVATARILAGTDAAHPDGQYTTVAKWFHWITLVLMAVALPVGFIIKYLKDEPFATKMVFYAVHESAGLTILFVTIARLVWRVTNPPPPLPDHIPAPMRLAATTVHWLLYLGLIVQPVLGFVMTNAFGFPMQGATAYLGVIDIPALVAENQALAGTLKTLHTWVGYSIAALLAMHIAGAVYHHAIRRDGTLMRML
ncbi:cytochrome b [Elioraea sp.]|uniref:cytochrome b n=1 Tax=Elioraea sp. TaxID=2185103 RepID=UPI0021DD2172|nr:cytochrome b [Elioraea sp.]GIX11021.1 MAG: cytochrome b [Elioraea sp.]